ncbi:MAG: FAD-dependent oxidoreductase [Clostridium sp.]|uniref:NAD(P)/FAD-dependent oxidoreductase n=1 Tax=Clostridium sp. TaxID=1506 RepID=UPI00302A4AF0
MDYDVLILGGGIIGCALAYELSKYNLNIAVIEKDYDICNDTPSINTATIYDGLECEDELSSKFIRKGNLLMEEYATKFKVPYKRCGTLYIARNDEQSKNIDRMYKRAQNKNINDVKLIIGDDVLEYEPNIGKGILKSIYIPNTGVICSYDLALAYGEIAFDNGVNFRLEEEVESIDKINKGFRIKTSRNKFSCKIVIDTTKDKNLQLINEEIKPDNIGKFLKYMVIDQNYSEMYSNIIFDVNEDERLYLRPTINNEMIGAYSSYINVPYDKVVEKLKPLTKKINEKDIKTVLNWMLFDEPIKIQDDIQDSGYMSINVNHYGKVTMTPALALNISKLIVEKLNCKLKKDFNDKRREYFKFKNLSNNERNKIIEVDRKYGNIVCQCEKVTEGEIVDAIRRPLGARTVTGVKRRTGAGLGSCDGCYCKDKIIDILARETDKRITEVVNNSKDSIILLSRIKEFDTM